MAAHIAHQLPTESSASQPYGSQLPLLQSAYEDEDIRPCPELTPCTASTILPNAMDFSDPLLCVTPDKPTRKFDNTNMNASNKSLDSSKGSQKVRFDSTVEVKTISSHETSTDTSKTGSTLTDNSEDTDQLIERTNAYRVENHNENSNFHSSSGSSDNMNNSCLDSRHSSSTDSKCSSNITVSTCESDDVNFVDVLAEDVHLRNSHIYGTKLAKHRKSCVVRTSLWGEDGVGDNTFAKPEFNSTSVLQKQLEELKGEEVDLDEQVEQKLAESEALRTRLNEKAAMKVNGPVGYGGLASLDVREEFRTDVIPRTKAKYSIKHRTTQADLIPPPDIMEFFSPDLQKESVCLSLDVPVVEAVPQTADLDHAFDVYRHIRAWEGW